MTSELDKFTYSTTYRQDYGKKQIVTGADLTVEQGKVDCRAKAYPGEAAIRNSEKPQPLCPCSGNQQPRGLGYGNNGRVAPPLNLSKEELSEMMYKAAETGNIKPEVNGAVKPPDQSMPSQEEKFRPGGQYGMQYDIPQNRDLPDTFKPSDQANPYSFDRPCYCPPGKPESGPQNYGPAWIRSKVEDELIEERMSGGKPLSVPQDVAKLIEPEVPAARVSCAPQADVSKFDQPNTFMRKLYEKYPYLYKILQETPPEELIARVFKDRFLSTYQVDYLHMGVGKENLQRGGDDHGMKYFSPEGEPEPHMIPGCKYVSKRGAQQTRIAARKKGDLTNKKDEGFGGRDNESSRDQKEENDELSNKDVPRVSEYMASISKLGGEIISDRLYAIEAQNKAALAAKKNLS